MQFHLALALVGLAIAYSNEEIAEGRRKISTRSFQGSLESRSLDLNLAVRQSQDGCDIGYKACSSVGCCPTSSSCCGSTGCYHPLTEICCHASTYDGYCNSGESCCGDYCCFEGYTCTSESLGTCKRDSSGSNSGSRNAVSLGVSLLGVLGGAAGAIAAL